MFEQKKLIELVYKLYCCHFAVSAGIFTCKFEYSICTTQSPGPIFPLHVCVNENNDTRRTHSKHIRFKIRHDNYLAQNLIIPHFKRPVYFTGGLFKIHHQSHYVTIKSNHEMLEWDVVNYQKTMTNRNSVLCHRIYLFQWKGRSGSPPSKSNYEIKRFLLSL